MTLTAFIFAYVLGGLTFIPLLLAAILVPAWRSLPEVETKELVDGEKSSDGEKKVKNLPQALDDRGEGAASGTFAILRRYDFQSATAALNIRNNAGVGAGEGNEDAAGEKNAAGGSVYQSVYRSVFDRNRTGQSTTSIVRHEDASSETANAKARKNSTPANVYFIVLRHGHLMLYDSSAQMEVRHVISLAHHAISLSSGEAVQEAEMRDGDLFIKRTAIVLTPTSTNDVSKSGEYSQTPQQKPFFLFSPMSIEKEDFYHALLATRTSPPIPLPIETDSLIKLQSLLHSTNSLTPETRAVNAIISRLFLALHQTDRLKNIVRNKIEKKISRVQKPAFIASLAVHSIDLGDAAPIIANPRMKDLNISGDMTVAFDVRYTGGIKVTVSALAKLDLGARFKTRTADLLLSTSVPRLQGHALVRIKPPPSNRLWFCFEGMPEMEVKVEPVVQSRQITYTFILRAIEDRIRSVMAETMVKPNWDDISFFQTQQQNVRGGIWRRDGPAVRDETAEAVEAGVEVLKENNVKTKSMPSVLISGNGAEDASSAASSGSESTPGVVPTTAQEPKSELKRRSVASLPIDRDTQTPPQRPTRPLRSPSLTSPSASVASVHLDDSMANFDPVQSDSQLHATSQKRWRIRPAPRQQSVRKDAIEAMREMRDRTMPDHETKDSNDHVLQPEQAESDGRESGHMSDSDPIDLSQGPPERARTNLSTMTSLSSASTRSQRQQEAMQKGKNFLAATTAATNAARNWSWNAIQNRAKGSRGVETPAQSEPVGRGQPLPPPGVPLPGPQKGWLPSGVGIGSVKRKPAPALPPRSGTASTTRTDESSVDQVAAEEVTKEGQELRRSSDTDAMGNLGSPTSDDFGPWRENSGAGLKGHELDAESCPSRPESVRDEDSAGAHNDPTSPANLLRELDVSEAPTPAVEVKKKVPPPLPARPGFAGEEVVPGVELGSSGEHSEQNQEFQSADSFEQEDDFLTKHDNSASATSVTSDTTSQFPAKYDEPSAFGPETDVDSSTAEMETEELAAIPAPVADNVNESELEAEGVQELHPPRSTADDDEQADKRVEPSRIVNVTGTSDSITSQKTMHDDAAS